MLIIHGSLRNAARASNANPVRDHGFPTVLYECGGMRFNTFIAGAAGLAIFGFLAFRIIDLEQRVSMLATQTEEPATGESSASTPRSGTAAAASKPLESRVVELEKRVRSLSETIAAQRRAALDGPGMQASEEAAILSVMERESTRVRDVQLEWHRSRWLDTRQNQLKSFTQSLNLSAGQTTELQHALEHEIDSMVNVLKSPSFVEDPDQAVTDWQSLLAETDKRALSVLSPEQQNMWRLARIFERRMYWPWLPELNAR